MSTQININVDQQRLLERSNQQMQANRQAFLDRQRQAKVGEEGRRQLEANRSKQAIGPDGLPLYGQLLGGKRPWEEPAAFRNRGIYEWKIVPTETTQSDIREFTAQVKNASVSPLHFYDTNTSTSYGTDLLIDAPANSGPTFEAYSVRNRFALGSGFHQLQAESKDFKISGLSDFTFETYVKLTATLDQVNSERIQLDHYVWHLSSDYYLISDSAANSRHFLYLQYVQQSQDPSINRIEVNYRRVYASGELGRVEYRYDKAAGGVTRATADSPWVLTPGFNVALGANEWIHLCICRKSKVLSLYINGQLFAYADDTAGAVEDNANKTSLNGLAQSGTLTSSVSMAKTRFIKRALYSGNFTPS